MLGFIAFNSAYRYHKLDHAQFKTCHLGYRTILGHKILGVGLTNGITLNGTSGLPGSVLPETPVLLMLERTCSDLPIKVGMQFAVKLQTA